ncbi:hypothetical protein H2203_001282 [Taxawa tesnikishii (nom. ined.)]|nr:hypothetical protein H2203_001282 [Dothideales sp. JES 119]
MGAYINGFYVFAPVTATDHAGLLYVAVILSLAFSVLTLATRVHIKRRIFGSDDWLVAGATVAALAQYTALLVGLNDGSLGRAVQLLSSSQKVKAGRTIIASEVMFLIAVALSKCSIVFFIRRLFTRDHKGAWMICNGMQALIGIWTIVSMLLLTIGCGPSSKLAGDKCNGQLTRWTVVVSLDGILEIVFVAMAVFLITPLQMAFKIKAAVCLAFSFRLFVGVFAAIRVHYGFQFARSADPGLGIIPPLIWQEIELGYALISATIPTLRSFIRGYEKAMGWDPSYSASNSHQLQSFHQHSALRSQTRDDPLDVLRSDRQDYKADIWGEWGQYGSDHQEGRPDPCVVGERDERSVDGH